MSQHRKYRGYESQKFVAEYLQVNGFPHALPVGAGRTGSDITGLLGVDVEVKARRGFNPSAAMTQLEERARDGVLSMAVLRLDGQGRVALPNWPVIFRLEDAVILLRDAGYGDAR